MILIDCSIFFFFFAYSLRNLYVFVKKNRDIKYFLEEITL